MARTVTLVAGPPCAGKTTYVAQHARPGDIVLDQDAIGATAMRQGLARVAIMTDGTAWVIRCCPGPQRRQAFAQQIRATNVILLRPTDEELLTRAAHRPDPRRHIQAVRDWLQREALDQPARTARGQQPKGAGSTARRGLTTTQRGYGHEHQQARAKALRHLTDGEPCPFCQQPMSKTMSLDYDHYPPLALGGGGVRRLAHSRCNRQAGQALAQQRRRLRTRTTSPRAVNSQRW